MSTTAQLAALIDTATDLAPRIICAVRDFDADHVEDCLIDRTVDELRALVVVLAGAIDPESTTLAEALEWVPVVDDAVALDSLAVRPRHGNHAGFNWHKAHGEEPCDPCKRGHRAWDADRGRRRRRTIVELPAIALCDLEEAEFAADQADLAWVAS